MIEYIKIGADDQFLSITAPVEYYIILVQLCASWDAVRYHQKV